VFYWGLRDYGIEGQLGLEKTPEEYIEKMVEIFREVRRVLLKDGTLWLNMGDSYSSGKRVFNTHNQPSSCANPGRLPVKNMKPKNLCGIPWRLALALQTDGWWLRSDIIWHKPNPMPESVTDRPTKAHEYMFLLTKSAKYFYDAEAVKENSNEPVRSREKNNGESTVDTKVRGYDNYCGNYGRRNKRTVWTIPTKPFPQAHFATFPPALVTPCILAGTSERGCCVECGALWERVVEKRVPELRNVKSEYPGQHTISTKKYKHNESGTETKTTGWQPTCKCKADKTPCTVLDPFGGAMTTAIVAHKFNRKFIMIELSKEYIDYIGIPRIEEETEQRKLW